MPRRRGWDYAQLKSDFLSDPEFRRLRDAAADRREFVAAVGEWTIALADAWREDDPVVAHVDAHLLGLLQASGLIAEDGYLIGFAKWTEPLRAARQADADRKRRTPPVSGGSNGTPVESDRRSREVKVEGRKSETGSLGPSTLASRERATAPHQRTNVRGFTRPGGGPYRATPTQDPA